jgi:hypothetical protein
MKVIYKNQEIEISIFDCVLTNWKGKQELFTDEGIQYNFGIAGSEREGNSTIGIKVVNKYLPISNSYNELREQANQIIQNASGDVRVAFTNKTVGGRLGNTAVPSYSAFGQQTTPAKTMIIGVHLLNPEEGDVYHKEVKLPENCKLINTYFDSGFAPINEKQCSAKQEGNTLTIHCEKVKCSAADFNRLVPLYLEFQFDTTGQEPVTVFGTPYYPCEIPEIFGAYWRKKA